MYDNLPPIIQSWLAEIKNKKTPMNIRYNYFMMLSNIKKEVDKAISEFEREYNKRS